MKAVSGSRWAGYAMAAAATAAATLARLAISPILGNTWPYMTFLFAVIVSAWFGGLGPALLALTLGVVAAGTVFEPPGGIPLVSDWLPPIRMTLFVLVSLVTSALIDSLRRHRLGAERLAEEAERERERLRVTLASIADAVIAVDAGGRVTSLNRAAEHLTGWPARDAVGMPLADVCRTLDGDGTPGSTRIVARDGSTHAIDRRSAPIRDARGGEVGEVLVLRDIDDDIEARLALRQSEQRFRQLADTMPQIVWTAEADGAVDYFNGWWYDYTGLAPGASLDDGWRGVLHPADVTAFSRVRETAIDRVAFFECECRLRRRDGAYRWHLVRSVPAFDPSGRVLRRFGSATDIDDRKRRADASRFLAEAGAVLTSLVDRENALRKVAALAVPDFADGCVIDLVEGAGIRHLAAAHVDPAKVDFTRSLADRFPPDSDAPCGVAKVIRTGLPDLVPEIGDAGFNVEIGDAEDIQALRTLGLRSFLSVPLKGLSGTIGAISFVSAESDRTFVPVDLTIAEDLAHRVAIALDNTRLYDELIRADRQKGELLATLVESENRIRTLADSIPQLAWMAKPDGSIDWYNKRWYEYTGTTFEQMEGWGWRSVHDPGDLPRIVERFAEAVAGGQPWEDTFLLRRYDGAMRGHLSRAMPFRDSSGEVVRWFGTNTDITDLRRMEAELKEADRRKDVFLATLAHELRNPLAPIRNALMLMEDPTADATEREAERALASRQVAHLARLIDDLMDVSRINAGKIDLRREVVSLATIVTASVQSARSSVRDRGQRLDVSVPDEPMAIHGDPTRLEQVIWNLLNNAIKYTDPGGRIAVTARREGYEAVLLVADDGPGIDPVVLPRVFDMFVQGQNPDGRSQGGLGIGLGLVRALVELHGGRIVVRSEREGPNRGTVFEVRLPIAAKEPEARPTALGLPDGEIGPPPRRKILVVDDNVDAARSLSRLLQRRHGQDVRVAHDGPSALELAAEFRPEVVLLDIGMPGMDGYEVARRFRSDPLLSGTYIAALTGWSQESDRRKSKEAGFDVHLVKPVDPDAILSLLLDAPALEGSP